MIKFFRKIRQRFLTENKFSKYLLYAIGEIVLVMIGILIALQINNWNERKKSLNSEVYILTEILKNLNEDNQLVGDIIQQRKKAKDAIDYLIKFVNNEDINSNLIEDNMVNLLTFERYFPINNAYEILKSKGLQLSNDTLTTNISRYYDYEQKKIGRSIEDIEEVVVAIYNNPNSFMRFISEMNKDEEVVLEDAFSPIFKNELAQFLIAFKDNNGATLAKLIVFQKKNMNLSEKIEKNLQHIN